MRKQSGFTILELMVVICIVAILSAIAIPNYLAWLPKQRLRNASSELRANMQHARLAAVQANESCTVSFNLMNDSYTIPCLNKTIRLSEYDASLTLGVGQGTDSITFTSRGMIDGNSTLNFFIESDNDSQGIRIYPTGAIVSDAL
jgi:type IV fimbrial biogenesis protein FimU